MGNIIHGRNLVVMLDGEAIAACTSCSIDMDCELIEVASPTSARAREYIPGRTGWSVSSSHLVTHGIMLSSASLIGRNVRVTFQFSETELHEPDGVIMEGDAIVTRCRVDANVGSLAKGSFAFQGSGELLNADNYTYLVPDGNDGMMASGQPVIVRKNKQR